ncbi:MAG: LLM class flavin-dependent oxidoreductase [Gammaproteobacteria bacterium]
MHFGVLLPPRMKDWKVMIAAEDLGYDSLWIPDSQMIWSDCYAALALVAENTSRIRIGTGVAISGTRIAPVTAHSIASINQLAPGRVFLGLGTGHTAMRVMGMPPMKIGEFREYVRVVRALLDGEQIEYTLNGKTRTIGFLHQDMGFFDLKNRIPIYLAANGPRALKTAGEMADGLISVFNEQPAVLQHNLSLVREGANSVSRELPAPFPTATITAVIPLQDDEPINSERVIDEAGPWAVAALHFIWELYQQSQDESVVPPAYHGIFEEYCNHVKAMKTPDNKKYLEVHNGHGTFIVPAERRFMTPEVLEASCLIGKPLALIDKLKFAEQHGLTEVTIVPPTVGAREVMAEFSEQVMAAFC